MNVLEKIEITDAVLTSSTVAENDHPVHDMGTSYALNERVISLVSHKIYSSLQAGNIGHSPLDDIQNDADSPPVWWIEVSPTNRWMPFDGQRLNKVVADGSMTYVFTSTTVVNALSVINADTQFIDVVINFNGSEIYNKTFEMIERVVGNWLEFWTKPFKIKKNIYLKDLPPLIGAEISVTLRRNSSAQVSCGIIAPGYSTFIGDAEFGADTDRRSFSQNEPNQFGFTRLVKRTSKKQTKQTLVAPRYMASELNELAERIESVPAVWTTVDDANSDFFDLYILHGIADRFQVSAANPKKLNVNLELREI